MYSHNELFINSPECYFGVYFPRFFATREISTKITLLWAHKQFATWIHTLFSICATLDTPIARFLGPTWGLSGADRPQVGPMLASWTLLSGISFIIVWLHWHNTHFVRFWVYNIDFGWCVLTRQQPRSSTLFGQLVSYIHVPVLGFSLLKPSIRTGKK